MERIVSSIDSPRLLSKAFQKWETRLLRLSRETIFFEIHGARIRNRDREEQTPIGFPWTVSARMNEEFLCRGEVAFRFAPTTSAISRKRNVSLRGGRGSTLSSIDLKRRSKMNPWRILCSLRDSFWNLDWNKFGWEIFYRSIIFRKV